MALRRAVGPALYASKLVSQWKVALPPLPRAASNRTHAHRPVPSHSSVLPPKADPPPLERPPWDVSLYERLVSVLKDHPEGIPEEQLQQRIVERFGAHENEQFNEHFMQLLRDKYYNTVFLSPSPSGRRTVFLRPKHRRWPKDAKPGDREHANTRNKRYTADMMWLLKHSPGGLFLSQIPQRFHDTFGYLLRVPSLQQFLRTLPVRVSEPTRGDVFFRLIGYDYDLPPDAEEKLKAFLRAEPHAGVPESQFLSRWEESGMGQLWADTPDTLDHAIRTHFKWFCQIYKLVSGERVYKLRKEFRKHKRPPPLSKTVHMSGTSADLDILDLFEVAKPVGFVNYLHVSLHSPSVVGSPPSCSARIQFREVLDVDELAYKSSHTPLVAKTRGNEKLHLRFINPPALAESTRFSEDRETQLFVTGRSWSVTPGEIWDTFSSFGPVKRLELSTRRRPPWWCVIEYQNSESMQAAFEDPEYVLGGFLSFARPNHKNLALGDDLRLVAKGLPPNARSKDFRRLMAPYGDLTDCRVHYNHSDDPDLRQCTGFGSVDFRSLYPDKNEALDGLLEKRETLECLGVRVTVSKATGSVADAGGSSKVPSRAPVQRKRFPREKKGPPYNENEELSLRKERAERDQNGAAQEHGPRPESRSQRAPGVHPSRTRGYYTMVPRRRPPLRGIGGKWSFSYSATDPPLETLTEPAREDSSSIDSEASNSNTCPGSDSATEDEPQLLFEDLNEILRRIEWFEERWAEGKDERRLERTYKHHGGRRPSWMLPAPDDSD